MATSLGSQTLHCRIGQALFSEVFLVYIYYKVRRDYYINRYCLQKKIMISQIIVLGGALKSFQNSKLVFFRSVKRYIQSIKQLLNFSDPS